MAKTAVEVRSTSNALALVFAFAISLSLSACGLAESIIEGRIDDRDVEIQAGSGQLGTIVRAVDGSVTTVEQGVLRPGDRAGDVQAIGVVAFGIDPSLEPDKAKLEKVWMRVWVGLGEGDASTFGPLILSHLPDVTEETLTTGSLPYPPGVDFLTIEDGVTPGMRELDVSPAFIADWNAGRNLSVYAFRFTTASDGDPSDDDVDLDPEVAGEVMRIRVILHFGVDL